MRKCFVLVVLLLASISSTAQTSRKKTPPEPAGLTVPKGASAAAKYFSDVELVTHKGETKRFYSDLLKDRVVVINSFYTTCRSACVPMIANLKKVQQLLGDRAGEVSLISISVDPVTDTPERLFDFARTHGAGDSWLFLSGKPENVNSALTKLGKYNKNKQDHDMILIVGNERTGWWSKVYGLAKASDIVAQIQKVADDKAPKKP